MIVSYNWIQEYLGNDIPDAHALAELLTFHSFEIESVEEQDGDVLIDVDVLPNRSSDCLCQRGIARELATLLDRELINDPLASEPMQKATDAVSVTIENPEDCPRFTSSLMEGVEVGESPAWLKERLKSLGVRSINNLVDATNYVMYAIGQPTHVYDADKFPQTTEGRYGFVVRAAREGETVALLAEGGKDEDRVLTLRGGELLIVNEATDTPVGLAGVKGGRFAEVTSETKRILVEAAHFAPTLTRQTARRNGIVIDASKRFENEPARQLPAYAQSELVELIMTIAGGTYVGTVDEFPAPKNPPQVKVRTERVEKLLGLTLPAEEMVSLLTRAGIVVEVKGDTLLCTGPFERTDLLIEEDFIEEIGRIYGYDKVASITPETTALTTVNQRHYYAETVRGVLLGLGFSEVITSSFRKKDQLKLQNALASDKGCLRSGLTKNITEVLDKNAGFTDLLGTSDTRVFEIGTVFQKGEGDVKEHTALALGVRLKQSGYSQKEDKVLAAVLEHVAEALGTELNWEIEKGVAEVNFDEVIAQLPKATEYENVEVGDAIQYQPFSVYPAMTRDIAMWVSEGISKADIETTLRATAGELCVRLTHVDEFQKDGRVSQAFRLVFQAPDRTLTDDEVNTVMDTVYKAAEENGWETR